MKTHQWAEALSLESPVPRTDGQRGADLSVALRAADMWRMDGDRGICLYQNTPYNPE